MHSKAILDKSSDSKIWTDKMESTLFKGLIAKFSQDDSLKEYLLKTGEKHLVEANANAMCGHVDGQSKMT